MTTRTLRQFGEKSALYNLIEIHWPIAWPDAGSEAAHRSNREYLLRVLPEELEDMLLAMLEGYLSPLGGRRKVREVCGINLGMTNVTML